MLDTIFFNAALFGMFLPFVFALYIWARYLRSSKIEKDNDKFFFRSIIYSLVLSICSILVTLVLMFVFYDVTSGTGQLLIVYLLRGVAAGLSLLFVRNVLVYLYTQNPDTFNGKFDLDKINNIFRYGVHAGFAAVVGLAVVIFLQIQKV